MEGGEREWKECRELSEWSGLENAVDAEGTELPSLRVSRETDYTGQRRGAIPQAQRVEHGTRVFRLLGAVRLRKVVGQPALTDDERGDGIVKACTRQISR